MASQARVPARTRACAMSRLLFSLLPSLLVVPACAADQCQSGSAKTSSLSLLGRSSSPVVVDVLVPELGPIKSESVGGVGCSCISKCGGTLHDHSTCDWCYVPKSCGHWWFFKKWDYCVYPPSRAYEEQSREQKLSQLWDQITDASVVDKSVDTIGTLEVVHKILTLSMRTSFDNHMDVHPPGREKGIHRQGVVCLFQLDIKNSTPFTGLLGAGSRTGLLRMGNAASIDQTGKFLPGVAIKIMRSNMVSGNVVLIRCTTNTQNFFDAYMTNHCTPSKELRLLQKFQQASACMSMVGLSDLCRYDEDGNEISSAELEFPYELRLKPASVTMADEKRSDERLLQELAKIPAGKTLYHVYAVASPEPGRDFEIELGTITTMSQCKRSLFGDEALSFRHQRMEDDFMLRPAWVDHVNFEGCTAKATGSSKFQCPFK